MAHRIAQWGIALTLLLPGAGQVAEARPTAADIAAARAECRDYRRSVERLEASGNASPQALAWERSAWDRACAYAEHLMVEAGLEKPSAAPKAPAPVPEIVLTQSTPAVATPQRVLEPAMAAAAPPAPAPAPTLQLKDWPVDQLIISEPVPAERTP